MGHGSLHTLSLLPHNLSKEHHNIAYFRHELRRLGSKLTKAGFKAKSAPQPGGISRVYKRLSCTLRGHGGNRSSSVRAAKRWDVFLIIKERSPTIWQRATTTSIPILSNIFSNPGITWAIPETVPFFQYILMFNLAYFNGCKNDSCCIHLFEPVKTCRHLLWPESFLAKLNLSFSQTGCESRPHAVTSCCLSVIDSLNITEENNSSRGFYSPSCDHDFFTDH